MSIAIKGLRVKPNYESLINVAVSDKLYNIKFPNRNATFLRNGFVLSQLDGEGMRQMEKQQEMASKESYKEHLLKEIAKNTGSNIHDLRNDNQDDMRKERIDRAVNSNVPEQYAMSQDDASMSQKDASISAESFPNRPRSDASRSHTSVKTESSSSSSSPNPPPDSAATADYTDEVQRQMELTQANIILLAKQELEKRRIAAEKVKKELEEIESNTLREQRMGQRYTAAKSLPKPMAKARVKKEETKEEVVKSDPSRSRSSKGPSEFQTSYPPSERRPRSDASRSRTTKGSSVKNEIKSVKSETKSEPMSVRPRSDASRSRTSRGTSVKSEKKSVKSEPTIRPRPRYTAAKTLAKPTSRTRVKSEPTTVKLERSRSRDTSVKIEPKAEDTSRPRGRPPTKVKLEDGTENTSRRRGRPAGSKNKPK